MTTNRNSRRITAELNADRLDVAADGDQISIAGSTAAIDRLLGRIQPIRRPISCDGQLSLFDPAPYTTIRRLPANDDPQLALTSSSDRGAA